MRLQQYIKEEQYSYNDVVSALKKDCAPFLKELKQTKTKQFLYRGHNYASGTITKKKVRTNRTPKDMDETTSEYLDDLFKKKFGWYARSTGVFATANINETYEYGKPFLFFPIGKYKYIWSPKVNDLYTTIDNNDLSVEGIDEIGREEYWALFDSGIDGHWEYDEIDLQIDGDEDDVMDELIINKEMFGIEEDEDINYNLLKFIPNLTFEEFIEQKEDAVKEDLRNFVSSYTNKNLKQAIKSKNEITFSCKEYYLVDPEKPRLEYILEKEFF